MKELRVEHVALERASRRGVAFIVCRSAFGVCKVSAGLEGN